MPMSPGAACARIRLALSTAAALLSFALALPTASAATAELNLRCEGQLALGTGGETGPRIVFTARIPFGEGRYLALSVPDTDRVDRLFYDAEVQAGSVDVDKSGVIDVAWTRATGLKAGVVGVAVGSTGDITSVTIHGAAAGDRPFDLFQTASASVYQGTCRHP